MPRQKLYNTEEEKKAAQRLAQKKYRKSKKGKLAQKKQLKKYFATEKGKQARAKYAKSDKKKQALKRFFATEKGKQARAKYAKSDKKKQALKRWRHSDKGKQFIKKYNSRPQIKLARNLRTRVYLSLKRQGGIKSKKTMDLVGCDINYLRKHLEEKFEPLMSWDNYGKWHVDHIIPVTKFDLTDPEQQKICFHYTNLQPLWGSENIRKSNK